MGLRARIAGNLLWTWGGLGVSLGIGFLLPPFLIHHLGNTSYGLWIVIGSFIGSFGLLDLGTRGSVGRNVAYFHAKGDRDGVTAIASTAMAFLWVVAGVVLTATFVLAHWLPDLFDIPPQDADAARWAFRIVGITIALNFAFGVFDSLLWGLQHVGAITRINILFDLVRAGATFWMIGAGHGIVALAVINLVTEVATQLAKLAACAWLAPGLRLSPRLVRLESARVIFGYGAWNFAMTMGGVVVNQGLPLIIGAMLGVALVTTYSLAQRLLHYVTSLGVRGAEVFIPVATALHAQADRPRQQRLLLEGGLYSLVLALFFVPAFLLLGRPFIALWVGPEFDLSALLLTTFILGEVIPFSQYLSRSVLLGLGRLRMLGLISIVGAVVTITAAAFVARPFGLVGIAVVAAVCGALSRGLVRMILVCRVADIPLRKYLAAGNASGHRRGRHPVRSPRAPGRLAGTGNLGRVDRLRRRLRRRAIFFRPAPSYWAPADWRCAGPPSCAASADRPMTRRPASMMSAVSNFTLRTDYCRVDPQRR